MLDFIRRLRFWWRYPWHLPPPASKAFLRTYEWRKLQYRAKKYDGSQRMACGRTPKHGVAIDVDHISQENLPASGAGLR